MPGRDDPDLATHPVPVAVEDVFVVGSVDELAVRIFPFCAEGVLFGFVDEFVTDVRGSAAVVRAGGSGGVGTIREARGIAAPLVAFVRCSPERVDFTLLNGRL